VDQTKPDPGKNESEFPREDEGSSPASTGATALFGTADESVTGQSERLEPMSPEGGDQAGGSASGPGSGSGSGFTDLIRGLQPEPPSSAALAPRSPALPPGGNSDRDASFTMLLQTLDPAVPPPRKPDSTPLGAYREPAMKPDAPRSQASASDGFTALLGSLSGSDGFGAGSSATPASQFSSSPAPNAGAKPPGELTRLFSSLEQPAARPVEFSEPANPASSQAEPGSLTHLFSSAQASVSSAPADPFVSGASGREPGFARTPSYQSMSAEVSAPIYREQEPAPTPTRELPGGGAMGMTQLFRKLDEPVDKSQSAPGGGYTGQFGGTAAQAGLAGGPVAPSSAGPSEVTRILDASRMRELELRNAQAKQGAQAAALAPAAPTPQPPAGMPQFQMPMYPQAPMMAQFPQAGMGSFPQPGGMGYGGGAGMPMMPAVQVPPIQVPVPVRSPTPAAGAPLGKLQQYVPLLLLLIVFLLVGLIVTVVFLLKK